MMMFEMSARKRDWERLHWSLEGGGGNEEIRKRGRAIFITACRVTRAVPNFAPIYRETLHLH